MKTLSTLNVSDVSYQMNMIHTLGSAKKCVDIHWNLTLAGSSMAFSCVYVCHRVDSSWKIFSASVYQV